MVTTEDRTTATPSPTRARWMIAAAGFIVVAAAVVLAVVLIGGNGDDAATGPQTPDEVMTLMATAVAEADPAQFTNLTYSSTAFEGWEFLEWNLALGMNPVFSECEVRTPGPNFTSVGCAVDMGADYFFSTVQGEGAMTTSLIVLVSTDGTMSVTDWPPPAGLTSIESDMRAWIRQAHPELEDRMFGNDYMDLKFSKEAGELHMDYLDEYLAYRKANS